jgi:hypothetical protein
MDKAKLVDFVETEKKLCEPIEALVFIMGLWLGIYQFIEVSFACIVKNNAFSAWVRWKKEILMESNDEGMDDFFLEPFVGLCFP